MLATPADIFSIIVAMAFALPCFLVGVVWASDLDQKTRWIITILCTLIAGSLAAANWFSMVPLLVAIAIVFAVVNVFLGYRAGSSVRYKRRRVFASLGVSYTIGLLLGPLGVIILCLPSVLIANRNAAQNTG